jgi:hypothetical protein
MTRLVLLVLLLTPLTGLAQSIYRTVDEQGNVVFTDAPPASTQPTERVEVNRTNTVQPPAEATRPAPANASGAGEAEIAPLGYTVAITAPANETIIAMGPGNFTVSVSVTPPLNKYEGLQLFMDGEPRGGPQIDPTWDLTNVFRGQHDITVGVVDKSGKTLAMSPPVRVFVYRPSTNYKNRR